MSKKIIFSADAPEPIGPYSQAIRFEKLLFTSGQIALNPKDGKIISDKIEAQTKQVLENVKSVLESGGASIDTVLKITIYLKDMTDFIKVNDVYAEYFEKSLPARAAVEVSRLPKDALILIDCIAYTYTE